MTTNRSMNHIILLSAILTCMGVRVAAAAVPLRYHITELGTLGGESFAYGINESGQVTGFSGTLEEVPLGQSPTVHALLWKPNTPNGTAGTLHDLGSPGVTSYGYGINDGGQVTGFVQTGPGHHAFLWTPTVPNGSTGTQHSIGTPDRFSEGRAINGGGQITGSATREAGFESRASIWNSAAPVGATDRLHYIDFQSRYNVGHTWGYGINDGGQVTGAAWFLPQSNCCNERAFIWTPAASSAVNIGTLQDLGTLGGTRSTGFAINSKGWVTGEADTIGLRHAFLYDGAMHDLGTLGGNAIVPSVGHDINDHGHVTGWSITEEGRIAPFLYTRAGGMVNLNLLIDPQSGWVLEEARGINDVGQIVGTGWFRGEQRAFLLTPVPEPASALLFALAALGLVLTFARPALRCAPTKPSVIVTSILLLASAGPASAAMFNASSVAELIAAVDTANENAGPDSITLAIGARFTLTNVNNTTRGPTGLPTIVDSGELAILGNGGVIERSAAVGTPAFRLFDVAAGASLAMQNLTLQGGMTSGTSSDGGAIYNAGNLTLTGVTVQNNVARGRMGSNCIRCDRHARGGIGWLGAGGGIYSTGSVLLENSSLVNNQARGGNGGFGPAGGGRGGDGIGGGLFAAAGTATLLDSIVTGNTAWGGAGGGGIGPGSTPGLPGGGHGGGLYFASAQVGLDEFTFTHTTGNTASTSFPNIYGPFEILPNQLPGDFNHDGTVDAADYVVWRKGLGTTYTQTDYNTWRAHFGQTAGSGATGSASTPPVPEPAAFLLFISGAVLLAIWRPLCRTATV